MEKNGKNSSSSKSGLLSEAEREDIRNEKLSPKTRSTLTSKKTGKFTTKLELIVNDLELALSKNITKTLLSNYKPFFQLERLSEILDNFLTLSNMPTYRISATVRSGTKNRVFELAKVNYSLNDTTVEEIRDGELVRGLKKNEIKLIRKYIHQVGYNFPLELGKQYPWTEVKTLIRKEMNKKPPKPTNLEKQQIRERIRQAWNMIRENIDQKRRQEIIEKTGFWIQLKKYQDA